MKLSALFIALIPLLGSPVIHAETTAAPVLENRAAQGDITTPGGARRLTGDQTEALRASLINKPAKNVILLIGDGMGDSEITAARRLITARWASIFMRMRIRPSSSWRKRRGWPPATFPPPSCRTPPPRRW